jgi:hypothetical protein
MAKKERKSKKKRQAKGAKGPKIEASALHQDNLSFSNPSLHPWFVNMNLWLTNMIMTSNPLHVELKWKKKPMMI